MRGRGAAGPNNPAGPAVFFCGLRGKIGSLVGWNGFPSADKLALRELPDTSAGPAANAPLRWSVRRRAPWDVSLQSVTDANGYVSMKKDR